MDVEPQSLPHEFQSQLHVARLAEAEARSAAAIPRVADRAETTRVERGRGIGVIGLVEHIENLYAELRRSILT